MAQRDLALDRAGRDAPVQAVEALEPRAVVVAAVRAGPVTDPVTGELDLVRRVVDEEPRVCGLAQPHLERDCRCDQRRCHREGCGDEHPCAPPAQNECDKRESHDAAAGEHRHRAEEPDIPALVRHPDEEREQAVRSHRAWPEAPRVGAERADGEQHDGCERAEHDPRALARDARRVAHGVVVRLPANAARSPFRER